jgi:hypothetical protein
MKSILALLFLPMAPIIADLLVNRPRNKQPKHRSDNELINHIFNQHR